MDWKNCDNVSILFTSIVDILGVDSKTPPSIHNFVLALIRKNISAIGDVNLSSMLIYKW